jgi:N4-gp56 family major capsid protein
MAVFDNLNRTTNTGVAPGVADYYDRELLKNVQPELVHCRDLQKRPLPQNNGRRVQFRRFMPFGAVTTPLSEGVTPDGQELMQTALYATVKPYGAHVEITDEMNFFLLDNIHRETVKLLSDQAALSLDSIARDAMNAGVNVMYPTDAITSRAQIGEGNTLTYAMIKKAVRFLKKNHCKPFPDGFYHAILSVDAVHDLTADSMWTDVAVYQDKQKTEKYELGTIYKVKCFESPNAKVFKAQTAIYGTKASIAATAWDADKRLLTVSDTLTADDCRKLSGLLVDVTCVKDSATTRETVCIEDATPYEDAAHPATLLLRWNPGNAAWGTTGAVMTVVPNGGGNGIDVHATLVYGENAAGAVELGGTGRNAETIIMPPGSGGASDPLKQRGTVAWKVNGFAAVILQDSWLVRLEHAVTA